MFDKDTLRHLMEEYVPFNKFLGMKIMRADEGDVLIELPFRPEFVGNPLRPALHGGILSTMADVAGGMAVWSQISDPRGRVSTINLRVDYLRPARLDTVAAEARVVRAGNRVGVTDMRLFHPASPEETVATGKGVYNIVLVKDKG